ncbi:hypothetical protein [Burkholderia phage BCSR5]|nr:hypothetical protein [Burkholderia phage BCSR5]
MASDEGLDWILTQDEARSVSKMLAAREELPQGNVVVSWRRNVVHQVEVESHGNFVYINLKGGGKAEVHSSLEAFCKAYQIEIPQ